MIKMVIPKTNSPISAIRKYCVECSGGGRKEVAECNIYHCPLFPYRFGVMPDTYVANKEEEVIIIDTKGTVKDNEKKHRKKTKRRRIE